MISLLNLYYAACLIFVLKEVFFDLILCFYGSSLPMCSITFVSIAIPVSDIDNEKLVSEVALFRCT